MNDTEEAFNRKYCIFKIHPSYKENEFQYLGLKFGHRRESRVIAEISVPDRMEITSLSEFKRSFYFTARIFASKALQHQVSSIDGIEAYDDQVIVRFDNFELLMQFMNEIRHLKERTDDLFRKRQPHLLKEMFSRRYKTVNVFVMDLQKVRHTYLNSAQQFLYRMTGWERRLDIAKV